MNSWSMRKRIVAAAALVLIVGSLLGLTATVSHASTPQGVVIRTHTNMSVPNHVFRSEYERCSLPSRETLAALTHTKLKKWSSPALGNRLIYYAGDPNVVVRINVWKDQELTSGTAPEKLKVYTFGETFEGTRSFTLRCYNSRARLFNPNVPDFCPSRQETLERWTNRDWDGYEYNWKDLPSGLYEYNHSRPMAGFWVPRSSHFEIYKFRSGTYRVTPTGYLTPSIPHRDMPFKKLVQVYAFC